MQETDYPSIMLSSKLQSSHFLNNKIGFQWGREGFAPYNEICCNEDIHHWKGIMICMNFCIDWYTKTSDAMVEMFVGFCHWLAQEIEVGLHLCLHGSLNIALCLTKPMLLKEPADLTVTLESIITSLAKHWPAANPLRQTTSFNNHYVLALIPTSHHSQQKSW
jgi:hypothetical protein